MSVIIDDSAFKKDLDNLIKNLLPEAARNGITKASLFAEGVAKENCPVDLGQLIGSITSEVKEEGNEISGYISANTEYAIFVHEGTAKMQGRPFLRDAVDKNGDKIRKIIENSIKGGN